MSMRSWVALSLALGVLACGDDKPGKRGEADGGTPDAQVGESKSQLRGRVTYADGSALGQVEVKVGNKSYRSDNRGLFFADDLSEGEHQLRIDDPRVSGAQLKVSVSERRVTQAELQVLPRKKLPLRDLSAGGESADLEDSFKLRLPAGAVRVKSTQQPAQGEGEAQVALVKSSRDLRAAPGRLRASSDAGEVQLKSFGMVDVRLFQGTEELELSGEAELDLPLGPNSYADQQEIDAWSFDRERGSWKKEGTARVDKSAGGNGVAKLKATHFSWWCVGEPELEPTCLSGRLLAGEDQPLADTWVQAIGTSDWTVAWALTDETGAFCLSVPPGSSTDLSAFGLGQGRYLEWSQEGVTAGSAAASCGGTGCTDVGTITGSSLFEECQGDVTSDQNRLLLLSSGNEALDQALSEGLVQHGHEVVLGPQYTELTAELDLTPYDAVYLQANANWAAGDMPVDGQQKLINWVNCGGGLVTTEWTTWKIGSSSTFQLIDAIFPAARTTAYSTISMATYTQVEPDPTINADLPSDVTFNVSSYAGSESHLIPRLGATVYYQSSMGAGLLGWTYNLGRVATFSTVVGPQEVGSPDMMRLIANTVDWVQRD